MVEEYSDDELEKILDKTYDWGIAFSESKYFQDLTEEQKQESEFIVMTFIEYMYSYHLLIPEEWDESGLEKCCLDTLPRKITADESYYRSIAPVLSSFFKFSGEKGFLKNASNLARKVNKIDKQIVKNFYDPGRWGMAKSMLMAAKKAGVDIENEAELTKFMDIFNQQQLADTKKGDKIISLPSSDNKVKIGRNDQCPCGSGKKYKKCCGGH
ncbi:MAG: SEC-C metal-binding domain-containing protein [Candidatus Methanoperedens sp.]|nr:SEC-C metal-binding domain-containing protein [Candidatus Methanoperedens sp.]